MRLCLQLDLLPVQIELVSAANSRQDFLRRVPRRARQGHAQDEHAEAIRIFFFLLITPFLLCSIVADSLSSQYRKIRAKVERKITGKTRKARSDCQM